MVVPAAALLVGHLVHNLTFVQHLEAASLYFATFLGWVVVLLGVVSCLLVAALARTTMHVVATLSVILVANGRTLNQLCFVEEVGGGVLVYLQVVVAAMVLRPQG